MQAGHVGCLLQSLAGCVHSCRIGPANQRCMCALSRMQFTEMKLFFLASLSPRSHKTQNTADSPLKGKSLAIAHSHFYTRNDVVSA